MSDKDKSSPSKPLRASDVSNWDIETDVAIVGFGGAVAGLKDMSIIRR